MPERSAQRLRKKIRMIVFNSHFRRSLYHTPPGLPLVKKRSSGAVDHGLIIRESLDSRCSSGMYWERTAYISNRHPADCLHASMDFGPLKAGQSRTVHGKFYFIDGPKDNLLGAWRRDFPNSNIDQIRRNSP
jgi:hypothetical protein